MLLEFAKRRWSRKFLSYISRISGVNTSPALVRPVRSASSSHSMFRRAIGTVGLLVRAIDVTDSGDLVADEAHVLSGRKECADGVEELPHPVHDWIIQDTTPATAFPDNDRIFICRGASLSYSNNKSSTNRDSSEKSFSGNPKSTIINC